MKDWHFAYAVLGAVCLALLGSLVFGSSQGTVYANVVVLPFRPANLIITNLSSSSSVTVGAQLPLYATLNNIGGMAATNVILGVSITGPSLFSKTYSVPSLSPATSENITIEISGATPSAGTYTLNAFASYVSDSMTYNSNAKSIMFTVTSPGPGPSPSPGGGGGGGGGPPPPTVSIQGISLMSIPIISSSMAGQGLSSQIAFKSTSTVLVLVTFTVGSYYSGLINLSSNSIYVQPGQTGIATVTFKTQPATSPGTYVIPLTINVTAANGDPSVTEYLTYTVYSNLRNGLQIVGQTFLTNSLKTLSGVVSIGNAGGSIIRNGTLTTTLPFTYASNTSQITAFGLSNNVTSGLNGYIITWKAGAMLPGQVVYAYYTINNQTNLDYLAYPQNIFSVPSPVPASSVLKVVEISAPSLYSNTSGYVNASIFYTGTTAQQVSFYLTGSPRATIADPLQIVNASPNQLLDRHFRVFAGNYTGTLLLYLYVTSSTANLTESIPVIVSPAPAATTIAQQPPSTIGMQIPKSALPVLVALVIALIALLSILKLRRRRPKYSEDRARTLIKLRKRIQGGPID